MKKAQSALEFVFSYGWMLLLILIIIGVLYALGVFDAQVYVKRAWDFTYFEVKDWIFSGYDSPHLKNTFRVIIGTKSNDIRDINYIEVYDESGENYCGSAVLRDYEVSTRFGEETDTGGVIFENCSGQINDIITFTIKIGYTKQSGLQSSDTGKLIWKYEPFDYNIEFGEWYHSDYGSDVLTLENGAALGSYAGVCPATIPPTGINWVEGGAPLTWNLPGGCSSGECHGVGEGARCVQTCSYNAHGWLMSTVMAPMELRGQMIYLGGEGTCNNSFTYSQSGYYCPSSVDNYICLNDDLYFYLNNELLYFSGLSYHPYKCDSCAAFDNWCVPPIELTQSPTFNWEGINEVYILVEDWCISGGLGELEFLT